MANRLVIDGNSVYEIDEECERMKGMVKEIRSRCGKRQTPIQKSEMQGDGEKRLEDPSE